MRVKLNTLEAFGLQLTLADGSSLLFPCAHAKSLVHNFGNRDFLFVMSGHFCCCRTDLRENIVLLLEIFLLC